MYMTLRDPCFTRCTRRNPVHEFTQLQRELNDLIVPAMYVLQQLGESPVPKRKETPVGDKKTDVFEVKADVKHFAPEELTVKMVDNFVVVEGKQEEKEDGEGFISRQFVRRYAIPEDVRAEEITCNLSSDGVLVLSAPRIVEQPKSTERTVPINFTGLPATAISQPTVEDKQKQVDNGQEEMQEEPIGA